MELFLQILCIVLIVSGVLFFFGAAVGLLRFPDFYTRMHAAGKGDTLSTLLIMSGAAVYLFTQIDPVEGNVHTMLLTVVRIMAVGFIIMLTSPTSTHALMQAGYDDRIEPVGEDKEMRIELPALGPVELNPAPAAPATETVPEPADAAPDPPDAEPVATPAQKKKKKTARKKVARKKAATKKAPAKKKLATQKKAVTKSATANASAKKTTRKKVAKKKVASKKATTKKKVVAKKLPAKNAGSSKKAAAKKKPARKRAKPPEED